ncbi:hypothetical protein GCM10010145_47170 [Streptomyces ruber]|uniref:Uncharacterized protein n=2 Tax=Streptomyces TaxID=1883 RepID=A0A918EU50_9ACTN|nr:hypothetical protein [Streptomyces ruber]GGQ72144.1 hypothetical protein GCM10010145_47170 [Streptomyces ruber]
MPVSIPVDVTGYLVLATDSSRGATFAVNNSWDWAMLSDPGKSKTIQKPSPLTLRKSGEGYIVDSSADWPDYRWWCGGNNGIKFDVKDKATVFAAEASGDGFLLKVGTKPVSVRTYDAPYLYVYSGSGFDPITWKFVSKT